MTTQSPSVDPAPVRVEIEHVGRCPVCGSAEQRRWAACRDLLHRLDRQVFTYSRCRSCGLRYLSDRPTEAASAALYPDSYAPYVASQQVASTTSPPTSERSVPSGRTTRVLRRAVDRALPDPLPRALEDLYAVPKRGALVDYGCGGPAFLDRMRARGWAATIGVDMNEGVVGRVEAAGHRGVPADAFAEEVDDRSVALARLNHVFEHLYHPVEVLSTIRTKLVDRGAVHIAVPNGDSVWASVFRGYWYNSDPRHIVLYSPGHLRTLAERAGFTDVRIVHEVITRDIARSLGYVGERWGTMDASRVEALGADRRLRGMLIYPARISASMGRGDRFHAVLRA